MVGAFKRSRRLSTIFSIISVLVLTISMFLPQSSVQAEVMEGNNENKGSLKITTTDNERKPLEGVEFTVYKDGNEFGKVVSNKDGIAELKNLPYGIYTFKQTKGLEGYDVDPFVNKVTISKDWEVHEFKIGNSKIKGLLRVFKTDQDENPLEGVEFTVYKDGKEMQKLITNKDGQASKELSYGNYAVKETKALEGYIATEHTFTCEMDVQNKGCDYYETNRLVKGNIQITKVDDEGRPLEGVEFTVYNKEGNEITKVVTDKEGQAYVNGLTYGKYSFKETKTKPGYVANDKEISFEVKENGKTQKFDVVNKLIKDSIEINVTGDNQKPLAGVELGVYDLNDKEITKVVTNKEGQAYVKDLPYGSYYFKESKTVEGYLINTDKTTFTVKENGKTQKFDVVNKLIKNNIEINVTGDNQKPLADVELGVYDLNDKEITKVVTNKEGQAYVKDLPYGSYYFKETKTVEGYLINTDKTTFTVKENGKIQKFDVVNKLIKDNIVKNNIEINVTGDNQKPLAGVELGVYDLNDKEITKVVTNKEGQAYVKDLPYGSYYFKESKTVEGYLINTDKTTFTVKENGKTQKFDVVNKLIKGNIEIHKVGDNKQPLEGVEFTIYDEKGRELRQVITDKNGIAKSGDLPYDSYYFKETKAKKGYVINNQKFDFSIEENTKTLPFIVTNKMIKGNVTLVKVDADNQDIKLKGAVYELFDATNEKVGEYTTNENGEIAVENLVYGSYRFVEKEAPTDYVLDKKEIPFEVKENGQNIELTAKNAKQPKLEQPKPEQPKPEQPKPEQPKPEQPKPEQPKPEQPKPEQPKPEQSKPEQSKSEQSKSEQPKPKQPLPQTGGTDNSMKYTILGLTIILLSGLIFVLARRKEHN